MNYVLKNI